MSILINNPKYSYEGEGHFIGIKTMFFKYPGSIDINTFTLYDSVYINTNQIDTDLLNWCRQNKSKRITIETNLLNLNLNLKNVIIFYNINSYVELKLRKQDFIKIEIFDLNDIDNKINLANQYKKENVLLMPVLSNYNNLNKIMMDKIEKINSNIRFMPPVHQLLNLD